MEEEIITPEEEVFDYHKLRYILDKDGYVCHASLGGLVICDLGECTEYNGDVPDGYETIEEWYEEEIEKLNAWKIVDGNLAFDESKYEELQMRYEQEQYDNSCVTHKELEGITSTPQSLKDLYDSKKVVGEIVTFSDGSDLAMNKINIKPLEELTNEINLTVTGANMLPNELTTLEQDKVTFTQNKDKSIAIKGTVTNDIEVNLAGTSASTNYILTFKKGIAYKLSGLVDNVNLNFYCFDGTDRELVLTSGNGEIKFDTDKHITQITISVKPTYTKRNVQVGDDLSGKTLYFDFYKGFYELLGSIETSTNIIQTESKYIREYSDSVGIHNGQQFYSVDKTVIPPAQTILTEYAMPSDFGTVTTINTDSFSYEHIFIQEDTSTPVTFKNTIYPMLSIEEKEYEPYNGSHYKINLGSNVVSSQELYPNMVYPSDNIYPSAYHYITIEDGQVNLYQGNDEISLNNIEMPSTLIGNNTIYTHQDTRLLIDYIVGGAIAQRNIHLEGYTTINNGFSVDLDGNMICNDATMNNANIVGGNIHLKEEELGVSAFKISCPDGEEKMYGAVFNSYGISCNVHGNPYKEFTADTKDGWFYFESNNGYFNINHTKDSEEEHNLIYHLGTRDIIKADYTGVTLYNGSLEEIKKNISQYDKGLELIKNTDIYSYNYKNEEDNHKKHIGIIIGDKYNASKEILNNENDGVDTYSMVSVCFNAIKELNNKIEQLENKIKELESDDNGEN